MEWPSRRALVLVFAGLVAGCGRESSETTAPDVRGEPLRRADALPPDAMSVGDTTAPVAATPVASSMATASTGTSSMGTAATAGDEPLSISFDELSGFDYAGYASESTVKHEVPAKILALSGRKIVMDGYMMPLAYAPRGATKFLLLKSQFGCCYAVTPKLNEWVEVTMEGDGVAEYVPHVLVTVWGTLTVKEELREGTPVGLYKVVATRTEFTEAK